jgi:hypothetical protein
MLFSSFFTAVFSSILPFLFFLFLDGFLINENIYVIVQLIDKGEWI